MGEYRNGKREGFGHKLWPSVLSYEGHWSGGFRNGFGIQVWEDGIPRGVAYTKGDRYEGEWKEDKQTGHGVYRWSDGSHYEGENLNNMKHG